MIRVHPSIKCLFLSKLFLCIGFAVSHGASMTAISRRSKIKDHPLANLGLAHFCDGAIEVSVEGPDCLVTQDSKVLYFYHPLSVA